MLFCDAISVNNAEKEDRSAELRHVRCEGILLESDGMLRVVYEIARASSRLWWRVRDSARFLPSVWNNRASEHRFLILIVPAWLLLFRPYSSPEALAMQSIAKIYLL